jgi:hypothetical protein
MILLVNLIETATPEKTAVRCHDDEFESFPVFEPRHLGLYPAPAGVHGQIGTAPSHERPHLPHGFHCGFVQRRRIVETIRAN